mgnify:CR=1 FL=1
MVRELVIGLKSLKQVKIEVVASNDSPTSIMEEIDQVKVTKISQDLKLFSQPLSFSLIPNLFRRLKNQQIVHLHTPNPLWELVLFFLLKKEQVWIITHHSDIVNQKFLAPLVILFQRLLYSRVDAFVIPTPNHLNYSRTLKPFKDKCHLIPFAFRFEAIHSFKPNESQLREIRNKHKNFAIFIGRLVPYKGVNILIEAMKQIDQNYHLVIIGDGPEKERLMELTRTNNLDKQIQFLGKVPEIELYHYLYASEFLVLPSLNQSENFGIVQLEAFAMKKAVIVSNLKSGASSLVNHEVNGLLVEPHNVSDLTQKMSLLFSNSAKAKEMGERAHERLARDYSFQAMISDHMKLYEKLLEHKRKGET